ncbi:MAG: glutathione S-transferase N-terminal domain-containing protein, partial [Methylophagaceae bacterium]
ELRSHIPELDKNKEYLILCAAGIRAAAATLLLRQKDIKARYIEGGIKHWPFNTADGLDLELILFDFCPYAQRGVISLQQNKIPHKLTYLDPDNLPDWFAEVSPFGKVPILRVDGKTTIFESSVINELIALVSTSQMLPADPVERSVCRSWTEFGSTLLGQITGMLSVADEDEFISKRTYFHENLQRLEEQLDGRGPFFAGNEFSLVDSTYAPLFMRIRHLNKKVPLFNNENFPLVTQWADKLLALDSVQESSPESFDSIYDRFIQRRGKDGWLGKKCA